MMEDNRDEDSIAWHSDFSDHNTMAETWRYSNLDGFNIVTDDGRYAYFDVTAQLKKLPNSRA